LRLSASIFSGNPAGYIPDGERGPFPPAIDFIGAFCSAEHLIAPQKSPETVILEDFGVAIHGQGFADRDVMENLADQCLDARKGF
jgi:hypothetical protein